MAEAARVYSPRCQQGEGGGATWNRAKCPAGKLTPTEEWMDGKEVSGSVSTICDAQGAEYLSLLKNTLDSFLFPSVLRQRSQSAKHAEAKHCNATQSKPIRSASPTDRYPKSKSFPPHLKRTNACPQGFSSTHHYRHVNRLSTGQRHMINSQRILKHRTESRKSESDPETKLMKIFESESFKNGVKPKADNDTALVDLSSIESLLDELPINNDLREFFEELLDTTLNSDDDDTDNNDLNKSGGTQPAAVSKPSDPSRHTLISAVKNISTEAPPTFKPNQVQIEQKKVVWKNPLYKLVKSKYLEQKTEGIIIKSLRIQTTSAKSLPYRKIIPKLEESQIEMNADSFLEILERNMISQSAKKKRKLQTIRRNIPGNVNRTRRLLNKNTSNPKRRLMYTMENQLHEEGFRRSQFFQSLKNIASLKKQKQRDIEFNARMQCDTEECAS